MLRRRAFTLIELLVTITIIGMLAALMMGALRMAGNSARDYATKATIAKLNSIIMQRYESYMVRRAPITIPPGTPPNTAALMRLNAIRDLMRMEMPDHYSDITTSPFAFRYTVNGNFVFCTVPEPALHRLYAAKPTAGRTSNYEPGKCLYLLISMGSPEALEQFNQSEIGIDTDGWQYFADGWGKPLFFLRWAPGFSNRWDLLTAAGFTNVGFPPPASPIGPSDIQSGDPVIDHDPFDTRNVNNGQNRTPNAFRLVPLIYSMGTSSDPGVFIGGDKYQCSGNPYQTFSDTPQPPGSGQMLLLGTPLSGTAAGIITNHHIEQR